MKPTVLSLWCLATLFATCKKEYSATAVTTSLEGEYYAASTFDIKEPPTLYTNTGTTTDEGIIRDYIARHTTPWDHADTIFYFNTTTAPAYEDFRIDITTPSTAIANSTRMLLRNFTFDIAQSPGTKITLYSRDSLQRIYPVNSSVHCDALLNASGIVKQEYVCLPDGSSSRCRYKRETFIINRNGELYVPLLSVFVYDQNEMGDVACTQFGNRVWNGVNPTLTSELPADDTIIVQYKELKLIKR